MSAPELELVEHLKRCDRWPASTLARSVVAPPAFGPVVVSTVRLTREHPVAALVDALAGVFAPFETMVFRLLEFSLAVENYRLSQCQPAVPEVHVMKNAKVVAGTFVVSLVEQLAIVGGKRVKLAKRGAVGRVEHTHEGEALVFFQGAPIGTTCSREALEVIDAEFLGSLAGSNASKARRLNRMFRGMKSLATAQA